MIAQESGGKNCSNDGCPAGTQNPSGTPASYGSTQFVVATFVDRMVQFGKGRPASNNANLFYKTLFNTDANLTSDEKKTLGYIDADGKDTGLQKLLQAADARARGVADWKTRIEKLVNATTDPTAIGDVALEAYAKATGFAHVAKSTSGEARTMYERMVRWQQMKLLITPLRGADANATLVALDDKSAAEKKAGISTTSSARFESLLSGLGMTAAGIEPYIGRNIVWNEGWEGFRSAAIFADNTAQSFLLTDPNSMFKSVAKFSMVSDREMKGKYAEYSAKFKSASERDLVKYIAYFHNSGQEAKTTADADKLRYVGQLIKKWDNTVKLPCAAVVGRRFSLDPANKPATP